MKDRPAPPATSPADVRAERLAQALRANLHRRKAQSRATPSETDDTEKPDQ